MRRKSLDGAICPVARSLDEIGDWWTLLIVRDALQGARRFGEFQKSLGISKNILTNRLAQMVENGILEVCGSATGGAHNEYRVTEKGRKLRLVLIALRQWGEDHLFDENEPMLVMRDRKHGQPPARLQLRAANGRPLDPEDTVLTVDRHAKR
jgi:DNA-binding HxlR family transcriptional regulator